MVTIASLIFNMQDYRHHEAGWGVNMLIAVNIASNMGYVVVCIIRGAWKKISAHRYANTHKRPIMPASSSRYEVF